MPKLPKATQVPACPAAQREHTPEEGNLLGRFWGRATRTGREMETLTQDGSRGNFGSLILERKDEARHANSLQTFKGEL